jgi:hypothetical protein
MKRTHGLLALSALTAATVFAGCSDDSKPATNPPVGGSAGMSTGGAAAGTSTTAGTPSAGAAGSPAGSGGVSGGGAGGSAGAVSGSAGTGGTAAVIVPTVFLIDNIRLQPKQQGGGGDGAGGAGGEGAGGAPEPTAAGGAGGEGASAGAGGAGNEGGASAGPLPDFLLTFDQNLGPLGIHIPGFSPGPGGSGGPAILDRTTLVWQADGGKPGGAAKISVPFTVATQQADISGALAAPTDLAGYELLADIKLTGVGDVGECATAWMYVYGTGYANDQSGEPSQGVTSHVEKDEWATVRLDLDGPYGYHTSAGFKPEGIVLWGMQFNTWGCL